MSRSSSLGNGPESSGNDFWTKKQWPDDAPGYVFAGRAVLQLGANRYGAGWSDLAPATKLVSELPERYNLYTPLYEINRACDILRKVHAPYRARSGGILSLVEGPQFPTQEEWQVAFEHAKQAAEESWKAFGPFARLSYELTHAAKYGNLKTALRPIQGGNLEAQEWHFWNTEHAWLRFDACRVNASDPFADPNRESATHWIFLEKESFDAFCAARSEATASVPELIEQRRQVPKRQAGRKPKYNWVSYLQELLRRYTAETLPPSDYEVEDQMSDWCIDNFRDLPASSQQRERIAMVRTFLSICNGRD